MNATPIRMRGLFVSCLGVAILLAGSSGVRAENLGVPIQLGDSAISAVTPAGDVDTFVFDAFQGATLSALLAPRKGSAFVPGLELVDPEGNLLDLSPFLTRKRTKLLLKNFPFPATGRYALRVRGADGSTGAYQLKTSGKPPKAMVFKGRTLAPGETMDFVFGSTIGSKVTVKMKARGGDLQVLSVFRPDGRELAGGIAEFQRHGLKRAVLFPGDLFGDYGFRLGNATAPVTLDVTIKPKHARHARRKIVLSEKEPIITEVDPPFGRAGDRVLIRGKNFLDPASEDTPDGDIIVFIGANRATDVTFQRDTELLVTVPDGEGRVDVTVYNVDGQDGSLEDGFIFIPDPPVITTIDPVEGPDSGGTTVNVYGKNLSFIQHVRMGSDVISGSIEVVSDTQIRFVTDAHAPGLTTLILEDLWERTAVLSGAFTFVGLPVVVEVSPLAGTNKGGTLVTVTGQNLRSDDRFFLGGNEVAFTAVSSSEVRFTTPPHDLGLVDLVIEDPWGRRVTAPDAFEYTLGTFADVTSAKMPANSATSDVGGTCIAVGDIDKDKDPDVVIGRVKPASGNAVIVLQNNGTAGFSQVENRVVNKYDADDVALGDLDGDGDLDLVITRDGVYVKGYTYTYTKTTWYWRYNIPYTSTRVHLNDGTGTFKESTTALPGALSGQDVDILQAGSVVLGDLDGDKDLDIVLTRGKPAAVSYYYQYTYSWGGTTYYYQYFYQKTDTSIPATRVLVNDGNAKFTNESKTRLPSPSAGDLLVGDDVALGDVDGDGSLDIILTGDGSKLRSSTADEYVKGSKTRILLNDGKGSFTNKTATFFPSTKDGDDWGGVAVALGDLDGDGIDDLVLGVDHGLKKTDGTYLPSTRVFLGGKSGMTDKTAAWIPPVRSDGQGEIWRAKALAVADPNRDGYPDVFLTDRSVVNVQDPVTGLFTKAASATRWLINSGKAPLLAGTAKNLPDPEKTGDYYLADALALGDVDGDTDLDLVITTDLASYLGEGKRPTRLLEFR